MSDYCGCMLGPEYQQKDDCQFDLLENLLEMDKCKGVDLEQCSLDAYPKTEAVGLVCNCSRCTII